MSDKKPPAYPTAEDKILGQIVAHLNAQGALAPEAKVVYATPSGGKPEAPASTFIHAGQPPFAPAPSTPGGLPPNVPALANEDKVVPPPPLDGLRAVWVSEDGHPGFVTKDSGRRDTFPTGARRDVDDGKPRYELVPPAWLKEIALALPGHPDADLSLVPVGLLLRLAALYGRGARKYSRDNWKKGMPLRRTLGSLLRHAYQLAAGETDEDHASAVVFNTWCMAHYRDEIRAGRLPAELDDVPGDSKEAA